MLSLRNACIVLTSAFCWIIAPQASAGSGGGETITDIVAKSGGEFDDNKRDFDILLNAVIAADLAEALADPKARLTVFAPTDIAFYRLARDLGYAGDYDETAVFTFIVDTLTGLGGGFGERSLSCGPRW